MPTYSNSRQPIGIFDSGVGGLSIAKAVRKLLPFEDIVYVADTEFSPYGDKPLSLVEKRAVAVTEYLQTLNCKIVVMACNTATVNTVSHLRQQFQLPIVGVEPGIKPAATATQSNNILVLATENTLASEGYRQLQNRFAQDVTLHHQACPEFVSLVESLLLEGEKVEQVTRDYITPHLRKGCDQIVLGCTHFPFLLNALQNVAGENIEFIDTSMAVAQQVKRRLLQLKVHNQESVSGTECFYTTGRLSEVESIMSGLWRQSINIQQLNL